jgi:hypothetical protein
MQFVSIYSCIELLACGHVDLVGVFSNLKMKLEIGLARTIYKEESNFAIAGSEIFL